MTKVALSGAGGQVGSVLRPRLLERGVNLRSGGGLQPLTPISEAEEVRSGDLREPGAVDNAFSILEEVARSGAGVSAREIAENLGMPRATAYRILKHLVQQEYLVRSPDLSGFALGQRVRNLAGALDSGDDAAGI